MDPRELFKVTERLLFILGAGTQKQNNRRADILYFIYSKLILASVMLTTGLMWVNVPLNFVKDIQFGSEIMGVATIYTILITKAIILQRPLVRNLMNEAMCDRNIRAYGKVPKLQAYFKSSIRNIHIMSVYLIVMASTATSLSHVIYFDITTELENQFSMTNLTYFERPFPYNMWLPALAQSYYGYVYGFSIFVGVCLVFLFSFSHVFLISIFYYVINRIRVLQYSFEILFECGGIDTTKQLADLTELYNDIIQFVKKLNQAIQYVTLLEFMTTSIHLASSVFQIRSVKSIFLILFEGTSVLATAVPFVITYWLASRIQDESVAISQSIFASTWYNQNSDVKKCLHIIMHRTQKPIKITLGPFAEISTETVIKVFKTAMSYAAFLSQQEEINTI